MDSTRKRRTKDKPRRQWYAFWRSLRFRRRFEVGSRVLVGIVVEPACDDSPRISDPTHSAA